MVKNAVITDFWREIRNTRSRFISIILLLVLAVAFYSGLRAACPDMQATADSFYDSCSLYDLRIQSTLGLTDDDVAAVQKIPGVKSACGGYSFDALAKAPDDDIVVNIMSRPADGTNSVKLIEGKLPEKPGECAVDTRVISMLGINIGDTLDITGVQSGFEDALTTRNLVITGTIMSPVYINRTTRGISTLGSGSISAFAVVADGTAKLDHFTDIYVRADGAAQLMTYSDAYRKLIDPISRSLTSIGDARLRARRSALVSDARKKVADAQSELDNKRSDAEEKLAEGRRKLDDARQKIADARRSLDDAQSQLDDKKAKGMKKINDAYAEIDGKISDYKVRYAAGAVSSSEYSMALAFLKINRVKVDGEKMKLSLATDDAQTEINSGLRKLAASRSNLDAAQKKYDDQKADADKQISIAQEKIDDAVKDIADIPSGKWYVTDRSDNSGYAGYKQDSERMGALASVFPMIFFLVAALVCLTTMTRMVEDNRVEIGTYKALGYGPAAVSAKYACYGLSASLIGVLFGSIGMIYIPKVIMDTYQIMYDLPREVRPIYPRYLLESLAAASICTVGATLIACLTTLRERPFSLMRPQSPRPGRRVLLEYIRPIWNHMSFFAKVSSRNLLRYKKRFIMTVAGIGGCTALVLTGFGLRSSIMNITDMQFKGIWSYDMQIYLNTDAGRSAKEELSDYLAGGSISSYTCVHDDSVSFRANNVSEPGFIIAPKTADGLDGYIHLQHRLDNKSVSLKTGGAVITEKMAELLHVGIGDTITVTLDETRYQTVVADITENYVEHYMYMSADTYSSVFGRSPEVNELLAKTPDSSDTTVYGVSSELLKMDAVKYVATFNNISGNFRKSMGSINYVVAIILTAAAALAFVVLYNLMNINITERRRELATIKVLGFFDSEVTWYIVRENIVLTAIGIAAGLIGGKYLLYWLITSVEVDIVMFNRTAGFSSYALAAVLTSVFAVIVNIIGHIHMMSIDMVESLKTAE